MDKAAVLAYCNVLSKDGQWVGCECCFTIVYDVMIVCTSIYKRGGKSDSKLWNSHKTLPKLTVRYQAARSQRPSSDASSPHHPRILDTTC